MADSVCAFRFGNFNHPFSDDRARKGSTQQVFIFVNRAGFQGREDIILYKFVLEILNINFGCTRFDRLFFQALQLVGRSHIAGNRNDFATIILLQPRNNNRRIQPSGISKYDFIVFWHNNNPPKDIQKPAVSPDTDRTPYRTTEKVIDEYYTRLSEYFKYILHKNKNIFLRRLLGKNMLLNQRKNHIFP